MITLLVKVSSDGAPVLGGVHIFQAGAVCNVVACVGLQAKQADLAEVMERLGTLEAQLERSVSEKKRLEGAQWGRATCAKLTVLADVARGGQSRLLV